VVAASGGNPKLVGKNLLEMRDPDGKFWLKEMFDVVKRRPHEGWVKYSFMHPETRKIARKESFVKQVEGTPYFVGVGYHLPG